MTPIRHPPNSAFENGRAKERRATQRERKVYDRRHENKLMVISVKRKLTNDCGLLREEMLKSEALLTLSLNSDVEANSAPTLHGWNDKPPAWGVGALFADAHRLVESSVVWPLSRPNRSPHRTRWSSTSIHRFAMRMPCLLARRHQARR